MYQSLKIFALSTALLMTSNVTSLKAAWSEQAKSTHAEVDTGTSQDVQKKINANREKLFAAANVPFVGASAGKVIGVMFVDHLCGHCKTFYATAEAVLAKHPDVRILVRSIPLFGEPSVFIERAAQAAFLQDPDKYEKFVQLIHKMGPAANEQSIPGLAKSVGLNPDQLLKDMNSPKVAQLLHENSRLAEVMGINATPTSIIDSVLIEGGVSGDALEQLIALTKSQQA